MTHIMEVPFKALVITPTPPSKCEDCGENEELRPYGKDGAYVCFDCGMKDAANATLIFTKLLDEVRH